MSEVWDCPSTAGGAFKRTLITTPRTKPPSRNKHTCAMHKNKPLYLDAASIWTRSYKSIWILTKIDFEDHELDKVGGV